MNSVEKLAEALVERLAIQGPPDLDSIVQRIGLRVREVKADGFDGTLVCALDKPKGLIAVNSAIREPTHKRFTIGHEIGHYLIPHHRRLENVCKSVTIERWHSGIAYAEREANDFAAELLLPRRLVTTRLGLNDPSLHRISQVANEFSTSLTATVYRFIELTDRACCLVWSENNKAKWYVSSGTFQLPIPLSELPSSSSWAARIFLGKTAPDDLVEVPPEAWLSRLHVHRVRRALEHSIALRSYSAVLTFLEFDLFEDHSWDKGEEELLEELDPNIYDSRNRRRPGRRSSQRRR